MSLFRFLNYKTTRPLNLINIIQKQTIKDDDWNHIPKSEHKIEFYYNEENIGHIQYRLGTGQIGLFYIDEKYRNNGLGKEILNNVINEMKNNNIKEIWAVTSKDHKFWSNVYNKKFEYSDQNIHSSVTGGGYKMSI